MTKNMLIMFTTVDDVKNFVRIMETLPYRAKVYGGERSVVIVDACSLMGIFTLDLTKPIRVEFDEDFSWEQLEVFRQWEVNT